MTSSPASLKTRVKLSGVTLLETLLALVIGAVIMMGVLIYYQTASDKSKAVATIKMVQDIGDAVRVYAQSPDYPGNTTINLGTLVSRGLLSGSDAVNPWGGTVLVGTSGNYLGIKINNIPASEATEGTVTSIVGTCAVIAAQLSRALPLPSPGETTILGITYQISNPGTGGISIIQDPRGHSPSEVSFPGAASCQYTSGATTGNLLVLMDLS